MAVPACRHVCFLGKCRVPCGHVEGGAVAEHDGGYKLLFSHPGMVADLLRDFVREREAERAELSRSFSHYLLESLLPLRIPGRIEIPEVTNLEEVQLMLAERVAEWTEQWKQKGREDSLEQARGVLFQYLERRFGPLPEETQRRVDAITSIEDLMELSIRAGASPSLAALVAGLK
jgi:hypothetical protein